MAVLLQLLKICIITFNVADQGPDKIDFKPLLTQQKNEPCDVHAIGLQEATNPPGWTNKFKGVMESNYDLIGSKQLQNLLIVAFARKQHTSQLKQIATDSTATGVGGVLGNKGAVSIRFDVYNSSICLVNSHLAAHDHMLDRRIADYEKIVNKQSFDVQPKKTTFDHDYVFWFGDLNFRVEGTDTAEEVKSMVAKGPEGLKKLFERDQLLQARKQNRAFQKFVEEAPTFPPTFKFKRGTDEYDMKRRPAWCDRILWAKLPKGSLQVTRNSYTSHPDYKSSDHKPVSSVFTIKV